MTPDDILNEARNLLTDRALMLALRSLRELGPRHPNELTSMLNNFIRDNSFKATTRAPEAHRVPGGSVLLLDKILVELPERSISLKLYTTPYRYVLEVNEIKLSTNRQYDPAYYEMVHTPPKDNG